MYDFALIIHPTSEELLHRYEPSMKKKSRLLVRKLLEWMKPFKAAEVEGLRSDLGRTSRGVLVMCPLLSEQMIELNPRVVTRSVIEAARLAESLDVKMIGLTAFASLVGNRGLDIAKEIRTPLTNGMSYTLAMEPEAILRALGYMGIESRTATMAIIGITSPIGRVCFDVLNQYIKHILVTVRNEESFLSFERSIQSKNINLERIDGFSKSIYQADLIIVATNNIAAGFDFTRIKPGCVIFDASYPRKIPANLRDDILVIDGVASRPPGETKLNFDFGLPEGLCFPCMAETMILSLEKRYENYSLGKAITPDKIREIYRLGNKHGFEVGELTSAERILPRERILKIRETAKLKAKKHIF